jgi:ATP-dependent exoDNAse (exonuclease V) alpha subunit
VCCSIGLILKLVKMDTNLTILTRILFEKKRNVFLSGVGGCGKSYLAKQLRNYCKENDITCALTSTTGVSAYNIGGQTIHSWSGIVFNKTNEETLEKIIKKISRKSKDVKKIKNTQLLIVDEVSMLGGTYLEVMDYIFKSIRKSKEVFGGMQVLFTGDFLQLPPVNDVYAFQSLVWNELNLITLDLTIPKRFDDPHYAEILLRIRRGEHTQDDILELEERHEAYKKLDKSKLDDYTFLMSKKKEVNDFNIKKLESLPGMEEILVSRDKVVYCDDTSLLSMANIDEYPEVENVGEEEYDKYFMVPRFLKLKINCKIMIIQNIDQELGIVNGSRGTFLGFKNTNIPSIPSIPSIPDLNINSMIVELDNGITTEISQHLFIQPYGDEVYTRIQYPVILSYSITTHKCQGLTLSNAVINIGKDVFEAGQAYVALSRCKNIKSLYLSGFSEKKLYCDNVAKKFEDGIKKYKLK